MNLNTSTYLFFTGVICLTGIYFSPIWKISLVVPQYPKEIAIHIRINRIENATEKALEIMNVLNHNIGMKKIDPADIPELSYFPWLLGGLIVSGMAASFYGKNHFRIIWLFLLSGSIMLALYDLYLWQYDFGHNLAEDAPIKIESGSFQPPLLGTKEIANLMVRSYPEWGILFPIASFVLSGISLIIHKK